MRCLSELSRCAACALMALALTACTQRVVVVERERPRAPEPLEPSALSAETFCVDLEPHTRDERTGQRLTEALSAALSRVGIAAQAPSETPCPLVVEAHVELRYEIASAGSDPPAWHFHLALTVVDRDAGHRRGVDDRMLHVVERGASAEDALVAASGRLAEYALLPLSTALLAQPRVYALARRGLAPLSGMVRKVEDLRAAQQRRSNEANRLAREEESDEHSRLPMTRITPVLVERYYIGATADDHLLVLAEPHYLHMSFGGNQHIMRAESEQIVEIDDEGLATVRFEHTEIDAFPVVGNAGRDLVLGTRDPDGTGQLVVVDLALGSTRVLRTLGANERVAPQLSDAGTPIFYRLFSGSTTSLRVVERDGSSDRSLLPDAAAMGSPEPSADGARVWVPHGAETVDTIEEIEVATGARRAVLGPGRRGDADDPRTASRFTYAAPLPQGEALVVVERHEVDGAFVGRFDLATEHYERLAAIAVDRRVELSPDGRWLAIDVAQGTPPDDPEPADVELALVDTASGRIDWVTSNSRDDRLGLFSPDSQTLYIRQATREISSNFMTSRIYRVDLSGL